MNSMMKKTQQEPRINLKKIVVPRNSQTISSRCDHSQLLIENYVNFKRSSDMARCMFYENGSWVDYPKEVTEVIKLRIGKGMPMVEAEIRGSNRVFDLYRMIEIEMESGNQRSISWIDVDGKCFFPKFFFSTYDNDEKDGGNSVDENCPKIEIKITISDNCETSEGLKLSKMVNLGKRKKEEIVEREENEGFSSNVNCCKKLRMVVSESQSARWPKARLLAAEDKIYDIMKRLFLSGVAGVEPGAKVTAVHQCVRTRTWELDAFTRQMEIMKLARGESNMVYAWYGTSAKGVESILTHGFGMPIDLSGPVGRTAHGVGVYFSPVRLPQNSAMMSEIDENGEKHIILCRVILGRCEKVEAGSDQSYPSSIEYDTGVDDLENPKWYTVWYANMNTHILPECIVSYKTMNSSGSNINWGLFPSAIIAKLFMKLKSYLPLPKIQELRTLGVLYKERKFGKDIFMKKLRSVVGDDLLRSVIQEIRG